VVSVHLAPLPASAGAAIARASVASIVHAIRPFMNSRSDRETGGGGVPGRVSPLRLRAGNRRAARGRIPIAPNAAMSRSSAPIVRPG
jgi:hypothetical protein